MRSPAWYILKGVDRGPAAIGRRRTARIAAELRSPAGGGARRTLHAIATAGAAAIRSQASALPSLVQLEARLVEDCGLGAHTARVLAEARAIEGGSVPLVGDVVARLASPADWHTDPVSGYRWPAEQPFAEVELCPGGGAEVRLVWELGRCHALVTLAQAFALTKDRAYLRAFEALLDGFVGANPFGHGVHWACAMEVALRAFNLVTGLQIVARAGGRFAEGFLERALRLCYLSARHVRWNREWWGGYTNNHYLSDLLGLSAVLPLFEDDWWARDCLAWTRRELAREAGKQLGADGFNRECSITYHRFAVELLFHSARALEQTSLGAPARLAVACRRALQTTVPLLRSDGTLPIVGDNDGSHVVHLERRPSESFRHFPALAWMMGVPVRSRWSGDRGEAEVLWLRGPEALRRFATEVPLEPGTHACVIAPSLGLHCGEAGRWRFEVVARSGVTGHAHGDLLSLTATHDGRPVFLDPGSSVYTSDLEERNRFRGTAWHTTLSVDGREQYAFPASGPRARRAFGNLRPVEAEGFLFENGGGPMFRGSHQAYASEGIEVSRAVSIDEATGALVVEDGVTEQSIGSSRGTARVVEWRFQIGANRGRQVSEGAAEIDIGNTTLRLTKSLPGAFAVLDADFSPAFGVRRKGTQLRFHVRGALPMRCRFELTPTHDM